MSTSKDITAFVSELADTDKTIKDLNNLGASNLADLIVAVASSPFSDKVASDLSDQITHVEGRVRGRSKQRVIVEEEEDTITEAVVYTRPNGESYFPRQWSGIEDVLVLRTARKHLQYPLLYGPPGTGKTALTEAAFEDLLTIVLTGDSEVSDLIGSFIPRTDGESGYVWIDGPLIVAMKEGRPILLDEVGLGDPKVLAVLYSLMDGRGELTVTANPEIGTLKAAEGFFIIGATNPNAPGVRLSEALLSRFTLHVEVTTDWDLAIKLGVPSKVVRVAKNLAQKVEEHKLEWAPQFRELLAYREVHNVFGEDFALANMIASCPEDERKAVEAAVVGIMGQVQGARI